MNPTDLVFSSPPEVSNDQLIIDVPSSLENQPMEGESFSSKNNEALVSCMKAFYEGTKGTLF